MVRETATRQSLLVVSPLPVPASAGSIAKVWWCGEEEDMLPGEEEDTPGR